VKQAALILAAGAGTRMKSTRPKVVHELLGKPLVRWSVDAARDAGCEHIVTVIGHGADQVAPVVADTVTALQAEQLGTGHAVMCAREALAEVEGSTVVLNGDTPLLRPDTIARLIACRDETQAGAVVLTMRLANPFGYGRIIRDEYGAVARIVEQKDATPEEAAVNECNSGFYCFDAALLFDALEKVGTNNAQGEYYLTDVLEIARSQGEKVLAYKVEDATECNGVNSRIQLAQAAALAQERINNGHMDSGVTLIDPATTWIGPEVQIGADTVIWPNTHLYGNTVIGEGCTISPNAFLVDFELPDGCTFEEV
jgi:bifunctional UDP-N-acetylglucosamine pyrophosphorylase/glucosamine-1-phosphate N-acetyltransferase